MLSDHYTELTVVTIAAADNDDLSFSSDTGMAECLIVARRLKVDEPPDEATCFISLSYSPQDFAHANALAQKAIGNDEVRRIQDGPYGASPLTIGEELAGKMIKAPRDQDGASWVPCGCLTTQQLRPLTPFPDPSCGSPESPLQLN